MLSRLSDYVCAVAAFVPLKVQPLPGGAAAPQPPRERQTYRPDRAADHKTRCGRCPLPPAAPSELRPLKVAGSGLPGLPRTPRAPLARLPLPLPPGPVPSACGKHVCLTQGPDGAQVTWRGSSSRGPNLRSVAERSVREDPGRAGAALSCPDNCRHDSTILASPSRGSSSRHAGDSQTRRWVLGCVGRRGCVYAGGAPIHLPLCLEPPPWPGRACRGRCGEPRKPRGFPCPCIFNVECLRGTWVVFMLNPVRVRVERFVGEGCCVNTPGSPSECGV